MTVKKYNKVITKIVQELDETDAGEESYTLGSLIVAVEELLGKHFKRRSPERKELKTAILDFMAHHQDPSSSEEDNSSGEVSENETEVEETEDDLPLKGTYCVRYTEKSLLILGDTKDVVKTLKSVGDGRYIPGVKGWIFKAAKEKDLNNLGCKRQQNKLPDGTDSDLTYKEVLEQYPAPVGDRFAADLTVLLAKYKQPATPATTKEELHDLVAGLLEE